MNHLFAISTSDLLLVVSSLVGSVGVCILTIILFVYNRRRSKAEAKDEKLLQAEELQRKEYVDKRYQVIKNQLNTLTTAQRRQEKDITANHELLHKRITELRHDTGTIKENCVRHTQTFQQQEIERLGDSLQRLADRLELVSDTMIKNTTYRYDLDMISKNYNSLGQAITDLATLVERLRSKGEF